MGIGPFTTYAPPGVYTQTIVEPTAGPLLTGLRVPVIIGPGRETLSQTDFEMVRGSSSQADTPIFSEDVSNRWIISGTNANPVLDDTDGNKFKFKVRNYPIVDGTGAGRPTFDSSRVSVSVNGAPAAVSAVDGPNGVITLLIPPAADDFVTVNYYFHRKDTRVTDDVSDQVSAGPAVLIMPKAEPYTFSSSSKRLLVYVNDLVGVSIIDFTEGTDRAAVDVANDINAAGISGLTAGVVEDNQGLSHVFLTAANNVLIGSGAANGPTGFTTGNYSGRNKAFIVFNGPIVDGSDGGITATDPSKVVIKINGSQVLAKSVDGARRAVILNQAPEAGSTLTVEYWFNSWQDTFDYLPNSNIAEVNNVGIAPGRRDYVNGLDYIVVNDRDQSKIQWGTSFTVTSGSVTGSAVWDSTQITGLLIDDKLFGAECDRFSDPNTNSLSTNKFTLPLTPTSGNGRDTPLSVSLFNSVTNGRIDLPTDNPNLVTVYVGKSWRDAYARGPVAVLGVDGASNLVTLRDLVPADYKVYATFWYNRIADDTYTLNVVTPGPTGVGQYTINSALTASQLFGVKFGSKSGLPETIQWPSGSETQPDSFLIGGIPVAETVTITFDDSLSPEKNASITNDFASPYDLYQATSVFGNMLVDGGAAFGVNLATSFPATLLGQPVTNPLSFETSDRLQLSIDGTVTVVDISATTTVAQVVAAVNLATGNTNAFELSYGSQSVLGLVGDNANASETEYKVCSVIVQIPTVSGTTDGSSKLGFSPNDSATGRYNALNQPAIMAAIKDAPFSITSGINSRLILSVDGVDFQTELPSGSSVSLDSVVTAINNAYLPYADSNAQSLVLPSLFSLANQLKLEYNLHIADTDFHISADGTNVVTAAGATSFSTLCALLNDIKTNYNLHIPDLTFHQLGDADNSVSVADATTLQTASVLARDLKDKFNLHLQQLGVHGYDDTANDVVQSAYNAEPVDNTADDGGLVQILTMNAHGLVDGDYVYIQGVVGTTEANGAWIVTNSMATSFSLGGSTYSNAYVSGGTIRDINATVLLLNNTKSKFNSHFVETGAHVNDDTVNTVSTANATNLATAITLVNALKAKYNSHRTQSDVHGVNDTTNVVTVANASGVTPAGFITVVTLAEAIAADSAGAFNDHRVQLEGGFHVHSTNDTAHVVTAVVTELVARTGADQYANKLVVSSLVNTPNSNITVRTGSNAAATLGLVIGATASRTQPTAALLASALNYDGTFSGVAAAWPLTVQGLGSYLRIDSLTSGSASTLSFQSTVSTAFITSTNIGITPGVTGDTGEDAVAGFTVSSSSPGGSSGTGTVGQTYTDAQTGLRFTILNPSAADYSNGGFFTLTVGQTFTCDSAIPINAVGGVEITVSNAVNTNVDTTAFLRTYKRTGNEPRTGDVYYVSYLYGKTTYETGLYQDLKKIQTNFGPPNPDNPISLAARLAILNGAVIVGLKQVLRDQSGQVTSGAYIQAIDDLRKPITGNIKPDIIAPLSTDANVFAYLNQHCIFMSSPRQEGERMGVVGTAIGTTPTGVQAIARGLQSELMVVTYPDSFVITIQDDVGNLTDRLVDGTYVAAAIAGSTCSPAVDVATPWTRRQILGFKSIGRRLDPTESNQVAVNGVTIMEQLDTGLRIRHGLTTRTETVVTRTPSVQMTIQYVQQVMRAVLDPYIGQKFTTSIPKQVEQSMSAGFQNLINGQIVTKVAGITASVDPNDPTVLRTEAIYVPVFPLEYIVATMSIRIRA